MFENLDSKANELENLSPKAARRLQENLRDKVIINEKISKVRYVAGVDVGFEKRSNMARAAIAILSYPQLEPVEFSLAFRETHFPYIPGLLSFRELPVILAALKRISTIPDVFLVDGQGIAHPRRLGIASHLGITIERTTIGVAKSRLIGNFAPVGENKGEWTPLYDKNEQIGCVLRTRSNVKPLFISPGHKCGFNSAREIVMNCVTRYRLPETTRWADKYASDHLNIKEKEMVRSLSVQNDEIQD